MNWPLAYVCSSIGKKQIMACTGLLFCLFLAAHLIGNFTVFAGMAAFNQYAARLRALGALLRAAEFALIVLALIHIGTGLILYVENWRARPRSYVVKKSAGGETLSSRWMPYTGLYILLFLIFHLINFTFQAPANHDIYKMVSRAFGQPLYVLLYTMSVVVVSLHVKHGLWSAFQTLGMDHPKYTPLIRALSLVFSLLLVVGFASIPFYLLSQA